jgi:histidinol-phosphate aminotransferase
MPTFRSDIADLHPYVPGRGFAEIKRAYGLEEVIKLASNESPVGPFPEVVARIAELAGGVNRYPETVYADLGESVGRDLDVSPDALWFGGGGADLLFHIGMTTGGPGHSAVYGWPSFVMYRLATRIAMTEAIEVPLDGDLRFDLDALGAAVRDDTTVVYLCNPNNPTGTHNPTDEVLKFAESMPDRVLVVVDEAYRHFVAADDYRTLAREAADRPNLAVLHTFSKVFGLAGLRIGYLVAHPTTLDLLRRSQPPFTVTTLAQEAAITALAHQDRLAERIEANAAGRTALIEGLRGLGYAPVDSQTNFVFMPVADSADLAETLLRSGVIVRPMGPTAIRISVGTPNENSRVLTALPAAD